MTMTMPRNVTLACLTALVFLWPPPAPPSRSRRSPASPILGDMVRNVGGELVALHVIVGANGDAHVYEPKPEDARAVAAADVVFVNGLGFEGWMERVVEAAGSKAPVIEASAGIATIAFAGEATTSMKPKARRPSTRKAMKRSIPTPGRASPTPVVYVGNIAEALCAADTDNCAAYQANARRYAGELAALDREIRDAVAQNPLRPAPGHQQPRCVRLLRQGIWHDLPRPRRRIDGIGSLGGRRGAGSSSRSGRARRRRSSSRTSPTGG